MSEQEVTGEVINEVILKPEEAEIAINFAKFFGLEVPVGLTKAFEEFKQLQSIDTQNKVKLELCKWVTDGSEFWQDDLWKVLVEKCEASKYELAFEQDVLEVLGEEKKDE